MNKYLIISILVFITLISSCNNTQESSIKKLDNYIGMEYNLYSAKATDDEIENMISNILESHSELVDVEGKYIVENGDVVTVKYLAMLNGAVIKMVEDDILMVGKNQYNEEFERNLVGAELNKTINFSITIPKDYNDITFAGKTIDYEVKVKSIKKFIIQELNTDFLKKNFNLDTTEQFYEYVNNIICENKTTENNIKIQKSILESICKSSKFKLNKEQVEIMYNQVIANYEEIAYLYDIPLSEYYKQVLGMNEKEFRKHCKNEAEFNIKKTLVVIKIAEEQNIKLTEEELENINNNYVDEIEIEKIKYFTLEKKVVDFIIKNGTALLEDVKFLAYEHDSI